MEQLMWVEYMQPIRKINNTEKAILEYLVKLGSELLQLPNDWNQNLFVQQLDDGGMGSFLIFQDASHGGVKRKFGKQISEFEILDADGVPVLISLYVDQQNNLLEVDVWKVDYSPVKNLKVPD